MNSQHDESSNGDDVLQEHYPRRTPHEHEIELFAVALLMEAGKTNEEIAAHLGIHVTRARRLRTKVGKMKLLGVDWNKASSQDIQEEVRRRVGQPEVLEKLKRIAKEQGVPAPRSYHRVYLGNGIAPQDWAGRLGRFGNQARSVLIRALSDSSLVGVAYGETLLRTVQGADLGALPQTLTFFPIFCDPNRYQDEAWASTNLALYLNQTSGRNKPTPVLFGVSPVIPAKGGQATKEVVKLLMEDSRGYKQVFLGNGELALIHRMDALVTSIGQTERPWGLGHDDDYFVSTLGIDRECLRPLLAAEIGGVPIPREGLNHCERKRFDQINDCRLGMTVEDIKRTATEAAASKSAGVIVLATGPSKAECLLELVMRGLVTTMIVDEELETRLIELLQDWPNRRRRS